jgi:hypothetical protein
MEKQSNLLTIDQYQAQRLARACQSTGILVSPQCHGGSDEMHVEH